MEGYYLFHLAISLHLLLSRVLCDDRLADWRASNTTAGASGSSASSEHTTPVQATEIFTRLLDSRVLSGTPLVLGIAGGSGSGKTTLAQAVLSELGEECAVLISHDSYYRDISHLSVAERAEQVTDCALQRLTSAYLIAR